MTTWYSVQDQAGSIYLCTIDEEIAELVLRALKLSSEVADTYDVVESDQCLCND